MRFLTISAFLAIFCAVLSEIYTRSFEHLDSTERPARSFLQSEDTVEEHISSDIAYPSLSTRKPKKKPRRKRKIYHRRKGKKSSSLKKSPFTEHTEGKSSYFKDLWKSSAFTPIRKIFSLFQKEPKKEKEMVDPQYLLFLWVGVFVLGCNMFVMGYRQKSFNIFVISYFYTWRPVYSFLKEMPKHFHGSWVSKYKWFKAFAVAIGHNPSLFIGSISVCLLLSAVFCFCVQKFMYICLFAGNGLLFLFISRSESFLQIDPQKQLFIVICGVVFFLVLFKLVWGKIEKCLYFFIFALFGTLFILSALSELFSVQLEIPCLILNYESQAVNRNMSKLIEYLCIASLTGTSILMQAKVRKLYSK